MTSEVAAQCAVIGRPGPIDVDTTLSNAGVVTIDVGAADADATATIRRANFVVAFLEEANPSVLVDVGVAIALKKPLLLVAESSADIPARLLGYPWLLTEGLDDHDFSLQLRGFATAFLPTSPSGNAAARPETSPRIRVSHEARDPASRFSSSVSRVPERDEFHSDLEFSVAQTLASAGATVVAQMRDPRAVTVPDLGASFPELGASFSTVLVEIGGALVQVDRKKKALRDALRERGLQLGLLVTLRDDSDPDPESEPGILVLSLNRLEDLVEKGQLVPALRQARNRLVHQAD